MNSVTEFVKTLGAARLAAMGAVALGLIGFFVFLMVRFAQPQMGVLFTDLTFEDFVEIVKKLDGINTPYELRQDGAIILVPKDAVLRLRMDLAQEGLPAGGTVGYEIFDKGSTLGATSFVQNINRRRAIEGELARTISSLDRVQSARVHLVLPERQLFARTSAEPSASIVLSVRGMLDAGQVRAVQHLVASAVEGLQPGNVSIIDESGRLLASGQSEEAVGSLSALDERNRAFERRMQQDIEEILASVVGVGRSRVRVTAEIDYNKVTQTSDQFDPDGRVIRSTQVREESLSSASPSANETVSVGNELPSANTEPAQGGVTREGEKKSEEIVNYEISRTTKTEVTEAGGLKRLSVAVLVDGIYTKQPDGTISYAPRPQEQIEEITALVRTAMGFSKDRGDQLYVANLRFAEAGLTGLADAGGNSLFSLTRNEYFEMAEMAVIVVIALLVLLFVVRPLVRRIITPDRPLQIEDLTGPLPALTGPEANGASQNLPALPLPSNRAVEALKMARIEGDMQASAIRDVGEVVQKNPDEAVSILRQWIQQSA